MRLGLGTCLSERFMPVALGLAVAISVTLPGVFAAYEINEGECRTGNVCSDGECSIVRTDTTTDKCFAYWCTGSTATPNVTYCHGKDVSGTHCEATTPIEVNCTGGSCKTRECKKDSHGTCLTDAADGTSCRCGIGGNDINSRIKHVNECATVTP